MIFSPLDQFEIKSLISINQFNINNYFIYISIVIFIFYLFYLILINNKLVGNGYTLILLSIYDTILNMINNQISSFNHKYFPFIFTLMNIILISNLISMIPYSFALTAQLIAIISLSLFLWFGNIIIGFKLHGIKFLSLFIPSGTPIGLVPMLVLIELLSYSSRSISLGLRLSANILSGHLLMFILGSLTFKLIIFFNIFFSFIPILGIIIIIILEFAISIIQSYVFCILLSGYIKDSIYLH